MSMEFERSLQEAIAWARYEADLRLRNRFFVQESKYFDELVRACLERETMFRAGTPVFRARIMPPDRHDDLAPLSASEVSAPSAEQSKGGRLNPAGIVCLYAARDPETALAEMRPWRGARVTLATFQLTRDVRAVDLSDPEGSASMPPRAAWAGFAAGYPAHAEDQWAYLGTQYLAERLKSSGIAAMLYDSAMRLRGVNVALFAHEHARFISAELREVDKVEIKSSTWPPAGE